MNGQMDAAGMDERMNVPGMNERMDAAVKLIGRTAALFQTEPEAARDALRRAAEDAKSVRDGETAFLLLDELAWQITSRFEAEEVLPVIQEVVEMADRAADPDKIGRAHNTYGVFFMNAGAPTLAVDQFMIALEAVELLENPHRSAAILANIGELLIEQDDLRRAAPYLDEAASLVALAERPDIHVFHIHVLAERGNMEDAWRKIVDIRRLARQREDLQLQALAHQAAGWIRHRSGEGHAALRHWRRAVMLFEQIRDPFRIASIHLSLGDALISDANPAAAAEALRVAAEISGTQGYRRLEVQALRKLLPITTGPLEGLAVAHRLALCVRQEDDQSRAIRRNFVDIRIRAEWEHQERMRLERDYERDALTGLLSYRMIRERLQQMEAEQRRFAFLFLDVDHLKVANDRMGHAAGDMLLRSFAHDVADALPKEGMAMRKGGDEFIVLLPGAGRSLVQNYLQDLFARLAVERRIGSESLTLSCSVGVSLWPIDSPHVEQLEWMADQAMYQVKATGRGAWAWHESSVQG